jgi:hypothetical protein
MRRWCQQYELRIMVGLVIVAVAVVGGVFSAVGRRVSHAQGPQGWHLPVKFPHGLSGYVTPWGRCMVVRGRLTTWRWRVTGRQCCRRRRRKQMPKAGKGVSMPQPPNPRPKERDTTERQRLRALAKELWPEALKEWRAARRRYARWKRTGVCDCPACLAETPVQWNACDSEKGHP